MSSITIKGTDTVIKQASPDTNFNASSTLEYKSRNSTIASYLYFKVPLELKKDVLKNSVTKSVISRGLITVLIKDGQRI